MMDLNEAIELANEWIEEGHPETGYEVTNVLLTLVDACGKYRSLYEGAEKRIQRYRDVASKPDICVYDMNKDRYTTLADLRNAWKQYKSDCMADNLTMLPFDEWLFMQATPVKAQIG